MALVVVGLLAAPSLGVVNVSLSADSASINVGQTTVVHIMGQGTQAGLFSLAGDITATGDAGTLGSTGPMVFNSNFSPTGLFTAKPGTAGVNGAWSNFGSQQTDWGTPDATLYKAALGDVASYTITGLAPGVVTLSFVSKSVSGYKPLETDKTGVLGQLVPVRITVVPEPVTMALLALGGLVVARRRR
jgi:hypothetical protein